MTDLTNPIDAAPPETTSDVRASELKNLPLILKPTAEGQRESTLEDSKGEPYTYILCDVWVLDRSGVVSHHPDVSFTWKKALPQLREAMGRYIACRPVQRADDNAVVLTKLADEALKVAQQAAKDLKAGDYSASEEPF